MASSGCSGHSLKCTLSSVHSKAPTAHPSGHSHLHSPCHGRGSGKCAATTTLSRAPLETPGLSSPSVPYIHMPSLRFSHHCPLQSRPRGKSSGPLPFPWVLWKPRPSPRSYLRFSTVLTVLEDGVFNLPVCFKSRHIFLSGTCFLPLLLPPSQTKDHLFFSSLSYKG